MPKKITIEYLQNIALEQGGWCLSPGYLGINKKLWWQCGEGHIWERKSHSIIYQKSWCVECRKWKVGYTIKYTIEDMHELAEMKSLKCLSEEYKGNKVKLLWECPNAHTFWMRPNDVMFDHSCPECKDKFKERICRAYFEKLFNAKFPSKWPKWLVNEIGQRLELDGYCKELKIAFEFQGLQHFRPIFDFHNVEKTQKHDILKEQKCKERNIKLIKIPYTIKKENLQRYIINECRKNNIVLSDVIKDIKYTELNVFIPEKLERYRKLAEERNGKCLSVRYESHKQKLKFQCNICDTVWETTPGNVKRYWCPECGKKKSAKTRRDKGYQKIKEVVEKKYNGKLLFDKEEYKGYREKHNFECQFGHKFSNRPDTIISQGIWCKYCKKRIYKKFPHKHTF